MSKDKILKIGLPKGSLEQATVELFKKAGYEITIAPRSYYPTIDDEEIACLLIRPQETARYILQGIIDCGLTGYDWIVANDAEDKVVEVCELIYSKASSRPVRWVLAVPNDSPIQSVKDLEGKRISTEAVKLAESYLKKNGVKASVEFSWGATEVKPPILCDAIIDVTETGSSLKANNLRIVEVLLISTTRFIANKKAYADPFKRKKIDNLALLLKGALNAEGRVGLMLNVEKKNLEKVVALLPSLQAPTIATLHSGDWFSVTTVLEEKKARNLIPLLKENGAQGIVEYALNKVIE